MPKMTIALTHPEAAGDNDIGTIVEFNLQSSDLKLSSKDFSLRYMEPAAAQILARQNKT